jgi:phage terminase large subunit-like protein
MASKSDKRATIKNYPRTYAGMQYANDVIKGRVKASRWVVLACHRFKADVQRKDIVFDFDKSERVIKFAELLKHVKGKWATSNECIVLQPWQLFIFINIFGLYKRRANGLLRRKYNEAFSLIPRKNGKSIIAAIIGLIMTFIDGESGAETYCGATSEKQANEVFLPAKYMLKKDPELCAHIGAEIMARALMKPSDNSTFQRVIGNPPDGSSPHCGIVDEYHEHQKDNVYATFKTGMGAREEPLLLIITTAGDNISGVCYERQMECQQILEGVFSDAAADSTFVLIHGIDKGDDWTEPDVLRKANPNIGISVSEEYLIAQQEKAVRSTKDQGFFKTKHLNEWVSALDAFINLEDWKNCADLTMRISDFEMTPCKIGVDLSSRIDFTASCMVFTDFDPDGRQHYYVFPTFWLPEDTVRKDYEAWVDHIEMTEGDEIDTRQVKEQLRSDINEFFVEEIIFDPWRSAGFEQELDNESAEVIKFPQTVGHYTVPMAEFEAAVVSGRLHHPDHPVLNWMVSNLLVKRDTNGNMKPRKEDPKKKIDGCVAMIMAVGRQMADEGTGDMGDFISI